MKLILALFLVLAVGRIAMADCFPVAWKLPNRGSGCEFNANFGVPVSSQLWTCIVGADSKAFYLIGGATTVQTEGDVCFVVDSVVMQNSPVP